jgi:spore maturation protein CgeB/polysaccharide pyruvyl transferase WcaK-like protein
MRIGIVYGHISSNYGDIAINYGTAAMLNKLAPAASVHVVLLNLSESQLVAAEGSFKGIEDISFHILRTRNKIAPDVSSNYTELALSTEYVLDPSRFIADAGLTGCDLVLYNSGEQIFAYQDHGDYVDLIWRVLPALAAKAAGMRFISLPSTFGPFEAPSLSTMLRAFFSLCDACAVRESMSAEIMAEFLGVPRPQVLLDPSFFMSALQSPAPDDEAILGLVMRLDGFGLRTGTFYDPDKYSTAYGEEGFNASASFKFAITAARSFLDRIGDKVHLIIASHRADHDLTQAIAEALTEQGYGDKLRVVQPDSVSEYQEELAKVSFIVASRFHACILGLLSGRPIMGVYCDDHGHKMPGLFNMIGVPDYCQNLSRATPESIAESIVSLFLNRERAFAEIPERVQAMQEETIKWLKQAIESKHVANPEEIVAASKAYIGGVEAIRTLAVPDIIPVLYRKATLLKAGLNTTEAELNATRRERTRLKAELAKEKRTVQAVRSSISFQVGNMLVRAIRKPGRNTILLPYRIFRLGVRAVKGKPLSLSTGLVAKKAHVLEIIRGRIDEIKQQIGSAPIDNVEPRKKDLKIAVIMDKFTYDCFKYEANLIAFTPDNWQHILSENRPHLLLVESAWQGDNDTWKSQIVNLGERFPSQLPELVQWCKTHNIPTAFWNKEDPAHYEEFVHAARLFDYVFTTDADCIGRYKKDLGHNNIFCLPFAVQPRMHNPIGSGRKIRDIAFAGSWYEGETEYRKNRKAQMTNVLRPALLYDVDIYDRNYSMNNDTYRFPEQYQPYIVGELPYDEMVYAYKMYKMFLNVNSVIDSPTMFPRRVLEILASGTCILSGYCKGIDNLIGPDIVPMGSSPQEAQSILKKFLEDKELRDRLAHQGLRKVMREHTYEKRLAFVLQAMGIGHGNCDGKRKGVSIITCTNKLIYMENILANYDRQQYQDKELIIVLNNDQLDLEEWKKEAGRHQNVTVYQIDEKEPLGVCLNYGIKKARFDYISKFDDDNYYGPAFLEDLMNAFEYTDAAIVGKHVGYMYFESGDILALTAEDKEHCYTRYVLGSAIIVKRGVFDRVPWPTDRRQGSDSEFLRQSVENGFKIYSADRFNYVCIRRSSPELHTWKIKDEEQLAKCQVVGYIKDYATHVTC